MKYEVRLNLPEIIRGIEKATSRVIRAFAFDVVGRMKRSFREPKTGRVYKVTRTGRPHQASAPGQAPAVLTGFLTNSILTDFPKPTEATITIGAEYAAYLEKGTGRMAARPFVAPALTGALAELNSGGIVRGIL